MVKMRLCPSVECELCKKTFSCEKYLEDHIKKMHNEQRKPIEKTHACDFCEKSFARKASLMLHRNNIHLKIKFDCDQCEKSFSNKTALKKNLVGVKVMSTT